MDASARSQAMAVWAVANQKGGVGKTTTVVSCAGLLAEAGKRVLMVDLDPQGSLSAYFRIEAERLKASTYELFRTPRLPTREALLAMLHPVAGQGSGIALFPAGSSLATVERRFRAEEGVGLRLARALLGLRADFDHVLIDTPPVLGVLMINALAASEHLLLPVQTDYLAIKGLERMAQTLQMVVRARGASLRYSVVPTMFEAGSEVSTRGLQALMRRFADQVEGTVIPLDPNFREASAQGITPSRFAPQCKGVRAYRSLLRSMGVLDEAPRRPLWSFN
jgi:chromosome partitioning protein